jgi:hypothetical protein
VLEKPGKLDDAEWVTMRAHAAHTQPHPGPGGRADGRWRTSPPRITRSSTARAIRWVSRIIRSGARRGSSPPATSFDALTADRPYRAAMPADKALGIMAAEVGTAVDPDWGFAALKALSGRDSRLTRWLPLHCPALLVMAMDSKH